MLVDFYNREMRCMLVFAAEIFIPVTLFLGNVMVETSSNYYVVSFHLPIGSVDDTHCVLSAPCKDTCTELQRTRCLFTCHFSLEFTLLSRMFGSIIEELVRNVDGPHLF